MLIPCDMHLSRNGIIVIELMSWNVVIIYHTVSVTTSLFGSASILYFDRYLTKTRVKREDLIVVMYCCLLIASKVNDYNVIHLDAFLGHGIKLESLLAFCRSLCFCFCFYLDLCTNIYIDLCTDLCIDICIDLRFCFCT